MVARGIELVGGERGAGREDARELAFHELAGLGGLGLVADGDLFAGGEELGDVVVERVEGMPAIGWSWRLVRVMPRDARR
jgi:hypothetical protein